MTKDMMHPAVVRNAHKFPFKDTLHLSALCSSNLAFSASRTSNQFHLILVHSMSAFLISW